MKKNDLKFLLGEGLFCGEKYICDFEPLLKGIRQEVTADGKIVEKYEVAVRDLRGREKEAVCVNSLARIPYYKYFKVNDGEITTFGHQKLISYLQNQSEQEKIHRVRKIPQLGLLSEEPLLYVFDAKRVINTGTVTLDMDESVPVFPVGESGHDDELLAYVSRVLKLYPGVSDMLFIFELFSIMKPLIKKVASVDMAGAIYGPSGVYKTTLSNLISVGVKDEKIGQYHSFNDSSIRKITPVLQKYEGHTVVIDDYHFRRGSQKRNAQQDLADYLVRYSGDHEGAHVLLTAEFLEGPMSLQDRIVPVRVQEITDENKKNIFLKELNSLEGESEKLWEFYWKFGKVIYENRDEVERYLVQKLKKEASGGRYRIKRNIAVLMTVYNTFKKYFAGDDFNQFDSQILNSLSEVKKRAEQRMKVVERMEKNPDWAREVWSILPPYKERGAGTKYFYENDILYILPDTLKEILEDRLETVINLKAVRDDLFMKGILYVDKSPTLTVKKDGTGYYAIRVFRLKNHVREKYGETE